MDKTDKTDNTARTGKLYVVGIGPGNEDGMTIRARRILDECPVIIGYKTYIDLVKSILDSYKECNISTKVKKYLETGMRQETERCRLALETASDTGEPVCMVCSGDAGIYGMAGIILELAPKYPDVEVEIIPGVTAALSGSALLGAAVGHDCAIISLSDLLTPAEVIEKRLRAAAEGDFVICLYNPASRTRTEHLKKACEILLSYKDKDTVCGCVRNIGREGESISIMTLDKLKDVKADMFTTVFIGNSMTMNIDGRMVTPRGYKTGEALS